MTAKSTVNVRRIQHKILLTRAALPEYHRKDAEVHPLSAPRRYNHYLTGIHEQIHMYLKRRSLALWTVTNEFVLPENADKVTVDAADALIAAVQNTSELIVEAMADIRLYPPRYSFGDMTAILQRRGNVKEHYKRLAAEFNDYNPFGNGDELLVEAAQELARRCK